ncbi:MAG: T9SS type A sorting domain-containing protein [Ignavibacteriales bacterium]|nr:T9SS type A sorting domain-containing protein [Ignavibacteriales bacterium]
MKHYNKTYAVSLAPTGLFFLALSIGCSLNTQAQTFLVRGNVIASRYPVKNASVTFVNSADTTQRFSALTDASGNYQIGLPTSVESNTSTSPARFELAQAYPNPFSSSAAIPYQIKKESDVQITIYDILGRAVKTFNVGQQSVGLHSVLWDGRNDLGERVASGIYFCGLHAGGESRVRKLIFNRGGGGTVSLPLHQSSQTAEVPLFEKQSIQGGSYTIRVENTFSSSPFIVPVEFKNVVVQRDTTIAFSVNYLPLATLNFDSVHQTIRGFGAASPWYRPVMALSEVESAFGAGSGQIGYSILRITVDADSNLWSRYLPSARKALDMGAIVIASPWYAPANMVERVNNVSRVRYDMYAAYAAHLNSFTRFMKANGIPIYGLSVQNEPDITDQWTSWTPTEMLTFMKQNAGALSDTKVMAPESFQFRLNMSDPILNDSAACANTDIVCGHIYGAGLTSYPLAISKGKEVWMTEYLMGENNSGNNWPWALKLAQNVNDVMKSDMSAYVWWTIVRYYGPIGDGEKAASPQDPNETYPKKGEVTKKGYVMSQFSKFIRPGYYRVGSSMYPLIIGAGVDVTAYKDPLSSKVVVVAINSGSTPAQCAFRLNNGARVTFTPCTTSETKNCELGKVFDVTNGSFKFTMEALSITTFVSN